MQLPEASVVSFLRWPLAGPSLAGGMWGSGASAHKAFSGPIRLLPEVEHVWSWFPAPATTSKAPVHREQEAAQTLLVPMARNGLGGKPESAAFLSKHALGCAWFPQESFTFANAAARSYFCAFSEMGPMWVPP